MAVKSLSGACNMPAQPLLLALSSLAEVWLKIVKSVLENTQLVGGVSVALVIQP